MGNVRRCGACGPQEIKECEVEREAKNGCLCCITRQNKRATQSKRNVREAYEALIKYQNLYLAKAMGEISKEELRASIDAVNAARDKRRFNHE